MRKVIFLYLFIWTCSLFSQKQYIKQFDVIISLSEPGADTKVEEIKNFILPDTSGLTYQGYCLSQKCIVLKASSGIYENANTVLNYLKTHINGIEGIKNCSVREFYKHCT